MDTRNLLLFRSRAHAQMAGRFNVAYGMLFCFCFDYSFFSATRSLTRAVSHPSPLRLNSHERAIPPGCRVRGRKLMAAQRSVAARARRLIVRAAEPAASSPGRGVGRGEVAFRYDLQCLPCRSIHRGLRAHKDAPYSVPDEVFPPEPDVAVPRASDSGEWRLARSSTEPTRCRVK